MDLGLRGKRALVTGSTSGIGEGIAKGLAREGVSVVVTGRNQENADRVVGGINLFNIVRSARQSAGMGYWIDEAAGSRGHATAAVRLACAFAFEHLGLHRLEPAVMPRNARSNRVMEKAASGGRASRSGIYGSRASGRTTRCTP